MDLSKLSKRELQDLIKYAENELLKKEVSWRPFSFQERETLRNKWIKRIRDDFEFNIVFLGNNCVYTDEWVPFEKLLYDYVFLDGSKCGVQETKQENFSEKIQEIVKSFDWQEIEKIISFNDGKVDANFLKRNLKVYLNGESIPSDLENNFEFYKDEDNYEVLIYAAKEYFDKEKCSSADFVKNWVEKIQDNFLYFDWKLYNHQNGDYYIPNENEIFDLAFDMFKRALRERTRISSVRIVADYNNGKPFIAINPGYYTDF